MDVDLYVGKGFLPFNDGKKNIYKLIMKIYVVNQNTA